jgi:hypothetical protein
MGEDAQGLVAQTVEILAVGNIDDEGEGVTPAEARQLAEALCTLDSQHQMVAAHANCLASTAPILALAPVITITLLMSSPVSK